MKLKIFLSFLALTFGMASSAWAELTGDGTSDNPYQISTAAQLAEFASLVNGGKTTINAVLIDNIDMSELQSWTAIGDWNTGAVTSAYRGHFDGQGYTINNFNHNSNKDNYGIFGVVSTGCLIENIIVRGTLTSNVAISGVVGYARDATPTLRNIHSYLNINNTREGSRIGGILGSSMNGTVVVDRCTYSGILDGRDSGGSGNYGGIVGYLYNSGSAHLRVTNCLFDGHLINTAVTPGNCTFGGIVGYVGANPDVTITNCLSIGTLQSNIIGQFYGAVKHKTCSIINSYYKGSTVNGSASGAVEPQKMEATLVTNEQLASGEICFRLNERASGRNNWFQALSVETYPLPYGSSMVYAVHQDCEGNVNNDTPEYVNDQDKDKYGILNEGFCSYCGNPDTEYAGYMTPNEAGIYEIDSEAKLRWFAAFVSAGSISANVAAKANLTDNITLTSAWTIPIGIDNVAYTGTFDGKGHSITGFNGKSSGKFGLFGNIKNATIENFSIAGTLTCEDGSSGSGVVGWSDGSTIRDIHSSLKINATSGTIHHVGGIVGSARFSKQGTTVERCSFSGTMNVNSSSHDCFGGIAGYTNDYCVFNSCINSGAIEYSKKSGYVGGIVGYINNTSCKGPHNCLNIGSVIYKGTGTPDYGGAIVGRLNGHDENKLGDNYWKTGSAPYAGRGNGQNALENKTHEVLASQLASGEVTCNLGSAFYQTIGIDEVPVLDTTHGIVKKITDAKFATTYFDGTDVAIPDGVTAYAAAVNDNKVVLNAIDEKIAADDAVVLNGEEGYYSFIPTTGAIKAANNDLKISDGNVATDASNSIYALAKSGTKVGFRIVGEGVKVPAGKAYLKVAVSAGVKEFYPFVEEDATGIASPLLETGEGVSVYNLAGQKLSKLQKGINIVGGKKVLF